VEHDFDIVAIGVQREGGVITWVIGPFAGHPVVAAACGQRCPVKCLDRFPIRRLKREVDARDVGIGHIDEQLVGVEMPLARTVPDLRLALPITP
jgi:hypothetical protein